MSNARRRDEWDRWSLLIALVYNRTRFGKEEDPVKPLDLWPAGLVTKADRIARQAAEKRNVMPITMKELQSILCRNQPHG